MGETTTEPLESRHTRPPVASPNVGDLYSLSQSTIPASHVPAHFDRLGRSGYWGNLYADIADPALRWSFVRRQALLESLMDPLVGPKTRVVEIGPGTGNLVGYFASRGCTYRAFDAAPAMVDATNAAIARQPGLAPGSRCEVGDIHALPLDDGYSDVVVAAGVFEYLDDPARAVGELARITRRSGTSTNNSLVDNPAGIALITLPNARSLNRVLMHRLGFLTRLRNGLRRGRRQANAARDVRRTAYTAGSFTAVASPDWRLNSAHYYDVELLPYPITRLAPRIAFAAKRTAESTRFVPRSLLANGMVLSLSRSA